MEAVGKNWIEKDRRACIPIFEYVMGMVYLQIHENAKPIGLQTIIKNLAFIIKNVPFAARKAEEHFKKAIETAKEIGADGIIGKSYLSLGLLYRLKKRNDMARDYFQKSIGVFEEIEAEGFLKQSKKALSSLG